MSKKQKAQFTKSSHAKGPRKREFPAHLSSTPEEWRALKRQEWREVMAAFQRFQYGSAYVPDGTTLYSLWRRMEQMTESLNQPDWVAW